jgi:hypothetical protein
VGDFLVDPFRGDRLPGQHDDQVPGQVHRVDDLAPQIGAGRQVGGIPEHPQRVQSAHPPADAVQALLDPCGDLSIPVGV